LLTLDGDDELGDDWEDLSTTLLKHVEDTLDGEESVRILLLTDALEENGEVMMVVELLDLNLPVDAVLGSMLDGNREVTAVIEAAELAGRDGSVVKGTSSGLLRCRPVLGLEEADGAATDTLTLLDGCYERLIGFHLRMPLAAMLSSWRPVSPPIYWAERLAVSFLVAAM
jgi:hypothetical protein